MCTLGAMNTMNSSRQRQEIEVPDLSKAFIPRAHYHALFTITFVVLLGCCCSHQPLALVRAPQRTRAGSEEGERRVPTTPCGMCWRGYCLHLLASCAFCLSLVRCKAQGVCVRVPAFSQRLHIRDKFCSTAVACCGPDLERVSVVCQRQQGLGQSG